MARDLDNFEVPSNPDCSMIPLYTQYIHISFRCDYLYYIVGVYLIFSQEQRIIVVLQELQNEQHTGRL